MCPRVIRSIRTAGAAGAVEEYSAKEVRRRSGLLKRQPASRIEYRCGQSSDLAGVKFRERLRLIPELDDDLNERRREEGRLLGGSCRVFFLFLGDFFKISS